MRDDTDQDDDLDAWLAGLAGRGEQAEGRVLGQALRREAARRAALPVDPPSEAQLMAAAGTLATRRGCRACAVLADLTRVLWPLGAGALVLAAWLLIVPRPPELVLRGGAAPLQLLQDADPLARRERLAQQLEAAGIRVQRYERLGRAGLDAQLAPARRSAAEPLLRREGLALPDDGLLQVEIEAPR